MVIMPHPLNRKYQAESYQRIIGSKAKFIILRLPPGIGKTALAAQCAYDGHKTLAVVETKNLESQYEDKYGFERFDGKNNYTCNQYGQNFDLLEDTITADMCGVPKAYKKKCQEECPYPLARIRFIDADAGITNYSKFLSDRAAMTGTDYVRGFEPEYIFYDEAHRLSDIVVDHSGLTLSWKSKRLRQFCKPIELNPETINLPLPLAEPKIMAMAMEWLSDLLQSLKDNPATHPAKGGDIGYYRWYKSKLDKVDTVLACLYLAPDEWYIFADEDNIVIRPKTARFHFMPLFDKADKIVLMSGTISHKDIASLGITEFDFIPMPNPYSPKERPVYDLQCPPITNNTDISTAKSHASIIANLINRTPDDWVAMVHWPSKAKAQDWGDWLVQMTQRPVFVPEDGLSTDEAYNQWLSFKDNSTGAILSCWQFWTGVDAGYVNTNIIGDTPYPNFGDRYEQARFDYNPSEARVRVANTVEQGCYRNRRGHDDHYGPMAKKFNAIAGGSKFDRLKSAFDRDFWSSIKKWG